MSIFTNIKNKLLPQPQTIVVQEYIMGGDPDANLPIERGGSKGFRSLSKDSHRDLPKVTQKRGMEIAYYLSQSNPVAKRGLTLIADYTVGTDTTISVDTNHAQADKIQEIIDRFWFDSVNRLDVKLYNKIYELNLYGEGCYSVFVNPTNGHVRLGYIDPESIKSIHRNPENDEEIIAVEVSRPGTIDESDYYRVIHQDIDPNSPLPDGTYIGLHDPNIGDNRPNFISLENNKLQEYKGSCFFFAINKVSNAARGQSTLLPMADWLDSYDQILFGEVERSILTRNVIWDVSVKNATDPEQIKKIARENPPPAPGTVKIHGDDITWTPLSADLKGEDVSKHSSLFLNHIATGFGFPQTWLNSLENSNKSVASEIGEPAFKQLSSRQAFIQHMLTEILTFVLDQAALRGKITSRQPMERWPFKIVLPELRPKDLKLAADTMIVIVQSLEFAYRAAAIDIEAYQDVMDLMFGQLGLPLDLAEMRKRLKENPPPANLHTQQALTQGEGSGQGGNGAGVGNKVVMPNTAQQMAPRALK